MDRPRHEQSDVIARRGGRIRLVASAGVFVMMISVAVAALPGGSRAEGNPLSSPSDAHSGVRFTWSESPGSSTGNNSSSPSSICGCSCLHCGGGCTTDVYTVLIFGGMGRAELNGTAYADGKYFTPCVGAQIPIYPHDIATGYAFQQWMVYGGGSVACPTCSSTTFTASASVTTGSISMVLTQTSYDSWGGYVATGNQINYVSGTFNVPTHIYVGFAPIVDWVGYWVGIGGTGSTNLWQAGVSEKVYSDNSESIQVFYQAVKGNNSCCNPVYHSFSGGIDQGAQIIVDLSYSGGTSSVNIGYWNYINLVWWNSSVSFTPDQTTAEWIGEAPVNTLTGGTYTLPKVGQVTFTQPEYAEAGWLFPQNSFYLSIAAWNLKDSNLWATQYLTPSLLSGSGTQFTLTYSS